MCLVSSLFACSGQTSDIDAGTKDAGFDGIPIVCGVIVSSKDLCIHCTSAPGTANTCHDTCISSTNVPEQCGSAAGLTTTECGDIHCGPDCTCFDAKDSVCQCTQ